MQQRALPEVPKPGDHRRPRLGVAISALVGLVIILALLSLNRLPQSEQRLTDQALGAVGDLQGALADGDVDVVEALLAPGWAVLDLPGSVGQILPPGDPADRLEFYAETVDLRFAACEADVARDPVTRLVRCDAVLVGALPVAMGLERLGEVIVGVRDDRIVSVFQRRNLVDENGPLHYCIWAEAEHAEVTGDAFDINCRPTGDASVHNRLAAIYVDAGRPAPAAEDVESRLSVDVVQAVESFQHRPESLATIFSIDGYLVRYPGLLPREPIWPFPAVSEYLAWSSLVYEVELGDCAVAARLQSGGYRIACLGARWDGALVAGLGLSAIEQPVSFFVEEGSITGALGTTSEVLDTAVAGLCQWAQSNRPPQAAVAFRADCVPQYTSAGAVTMVALAEDRANQG